VRLFLLLLAQTADRCYNSRGEANAPEEAAVSDCDEAQRKAQQFATYWYCEQATVTRMEQHDPIALSPLASLEPLVATASDAPTGEEPVVHAYAWTAIVHPSHGIAVRVTVLKTPSGWYGVPVGPLGA
jgi:hypothetical protein